MPNNVEASSNGSAKMVPMALEKFKEYRPQAATKKIIDRANRVIAEYLDQGFKLTARQLFYQFVARGWLRNTTRDYKNLYRILGEARDGGLVDWEAIEDRTRIVHYPSILGRPASYHLCSRQAATEKISGSDSTIGRKCGSKRTLCSASSKTSAPSIGCPISPPAATARKPCSMRLASGSRLSRHGLKPLVLHLADHDP